MLAILTGIVLVAICAYQLRTRAIRQRLPRGPWSISVRAGAIDLTRDGLSMRLTPGDVESISTRSIRGNSTSTAIYARLSPAAAARLRTAEDWYPLCWNLDASVSFPPRGLIDALCAFDYERLSGSLRKSADKMYARRAPVDGRPWLSDSLFGRCGPDQRVGRYASYPVHAGAIDGGTARQAGACACASSPAATARVIRACTS